MKVFFLIYNYNDNSHCICTKRVTTNPLRICRVSRNYTVKLKRCITHRTPKHSVIVLFRISLVKPVVI